MTNILTKARERITGAPSAPQAPSIAPRLQAARDRLAVLQAQHDELALDATLDVAGAKERLATLIAEIATARDALATLKGAHTAAEKRDAEVIRDQRAALRKAQLASVKAGLQKRDEAAVKLAEAIGKAVEQWKEVVKQSEKAEAACPVGSAWPSGAVTALNALQRIVANELYRVDGGHALGGASRSFPGASPTDFVSLGDASKIVPLATRLSENSAYILASLGDPQ
jgi:hypothetical protein